VFGGLALAAGFVVLAGGSLTDEARVLLPAGLIALGVALLVKVAGRTSPPLRPPAPRRPRTGVPTTRSPRCLTT
jgi:hypothetical protein